MRIYRELPIFLFQTDRQRKKTNRYNQLTTNLKKENNVQIQTKHVF